MSDSDIDRLKRGERVYTGADIGGDEAAEQLVREARDAGINAEHDRGRQTFPGQDHFVTPKP